MILPLFFVLGQLGVNGALAFAESRSAFDSRSYATSDIINKDVAIIGGGSAGTYTAIRLKDLGKDVIVIEKDSILGGHTDTYIDKTTGAHINVGVVDFHNISIVRDYFSRLHVPITTPGPYNHSTSFYDFDTGKTVPSYHPASDAAVGEALERYMDVLSTNYSYLQAGYFLPDPIPEDLLRPFGDFVKQYHVEAVVQLFNQLLQNDGNLWEVPTVQILKAFDLSLAQSALSGFLVVASNDTQDLYTAAARVLGSDVLYSSVPAHMDRGADGGVRIVVQTPNGAKLVQAKRLVVAIQPYLPLLEAFDLTSNEKSIFRKFKARGYYVAVFTHKGISGSEYYTNIGTHTPYHLAALPGGFDIAPTGLDNQHRIYFGTLDPPASTAKAKNMIIKQLNTLSANGVFPQDTAEFLYFANHSPFRLYVDMEDIRQGFYKDLYALQGQQNTFWTGASWTAQDSSHIWNFTENVVLPKILASLEA